jgi:uncharacterized caspase-like protein
MCRLSEVFEMTFERPVEGFFISLALLVAATFCGVSPAAAQAQKRIALVIGNNEYRSVSALKNPTNDAADVTAALTRLDFEVQQVRNGTFDDMRKGLLEFARRARGSEFAIIFFAGHGIEVGGQNYLIPVDAELKADIDVDHEAIGLNTILPLVENASQLGLVILDACRNNPFASKMTRTVRTRSVSRGLAAVEPIGNVLVAFAAKEGTTADDGKGRNSPFTLSLLRHVETPGLEVNFLFRNVRDDVIRTTRRAQHPFVYGSLSKDAIYLKPPAVDADDDMRRNYELAAQIGTKEAWDSFLATYETGFFANLARAARAKILAATNAETAAAIAKAKAEAAEKANAANAAAERARADAAKAKSEAAERARAQAAEQARAEAARQQEQAALKAAEETRKAEESRKVEEARRAEDAQAKETQQAAEAKKLHVAALPANSSEPDVTRALQIQLRRVGCHLGAIDGKWGPTAQRAMESFNRHAGMKLEVASASSDTLDVVKEKKSRVCPLVCERGFRADGERCVAVSCGRDQVLDDDGVCTRKPTKSATKPEPKNSKRGAASAPSDGGGSRGGQQVICDPRGCRSAKIGRANSDGSLPSGCQRVNTAGNSAGTSTPDTHQIVCN